jgi:hypothetical protein
MILKIRDANGNVQEIVTIRGEDGKNYVLTDADKQEIASMVATLMSAQTAALTTEDWVFTLEDGSTVTKAVHVG